MRFLAGNKTADGFGVWFAGATTGKDLFELMHFFGKLAFLQRAQTSPNHFGAIVVAAGLHHLIDEIPPVAG